MYTAFFGLREKPFSLTPDPRYLFLAESHREALAHLLYGIEQGEGFICVTGEVGTGKTTLCRTLLQRLGPGTEVAFLFNPDLTPEELLRAVCTELGLESKAATRRELLDTINRFLLEKKRDGRRALLVIDEAQNLGRDTLEQIRLLSNLETETSKLIQIVLLGQPELDAILESDSLRQLRQRISVRWRLVPLSAAETREYVRHRLRIAGGAQRDLFTEPALRELHRRTGGTPRLLNILADRSLLAGYAAGAREVGVELVRQAASELAGSAGPRPTPSRWRRAAASAAFLLAGLLLGIVAWDQWGAPWLRGAGTAVDPVASAPLRGPGLPEARAMADTGAVQESAAAPDPGARVDRESPQDPVAAGLAPDAPEPELAAAVPEVALEPDAAVASEVSREPAVAEGLAPELASARVAERAADEPGEVLEQDVRTEATEAPAEAGPEEGAATPIEQAAAELSQAAVDRTTLARVAETHASADAAVPAIAADGAELVRLLTTLSPAVSNARAADAVLELWGRPASGQRWVRFEEAMALLEASGLSVLPLARSDVASLRKLNHPAILRVPAVDGALRAVLLRSVDERGAALLGAVPDASVLIEPAELDAGTREAYVVWRDFEALPPLMAWGQAGEPIDWLQSSLGRLGFPTGSDSSVFDDATVEAVRAFQRSRFLSADGYVGPRTKMALYSGLEGYAVPRLSDEEDAEGASG